MRRTRSQTRSWTPSMRMNLSQLAPGSSVQHAHAIDAPPLKRASGSATVIELSSGLHLVLFQQASAPEPCSCNREPAHAKSATHVEGGLGRQRRRASFERT